MAQLELIARTAIALVFIASLGSKIISRKSFVAFTEAVRVLGGRQVRAAPITAAAVVGAEALSVLLLLLPGPENPTALAFALPAMLVLVFTGALMAAMRRGVREPCRCFGTSPRAVDGVTVVRNIGIFATCVIGVISSSAPPGRTSPGTTAASIACGLLLAAALMTCEAIADLWRPSPSSPRARHGARA